MEDLKHQLSSLLGRSEVKRSAFRLDNELLRDPKVITAVVGLLVILAIVYCEFLGSAIGYLLISVSSSSSKSARRSGPATALLVGSVDAGKTSLFAKVSYMVECRADVQIVHNSYPQTHTSISTSSTTFPLVEPAGDATKSLTLVDLPGHPRLKDEFKKHVKEADAVVFVVDIVGLVRTAGTVAE